MGESRDDEGAAAQPPMYKMNQAIASWWTSGVSEWNVMFGRFEVLTWTKSPETITTNKLTDQFTEKLFAP